MQFGNLSGLVNGTEQIVFDYEVRAVVDGGTGPVSSITTGSILNGNEDGWYTIIVRQISANVAITDICMKPNGSASGYGLRSISANNTSVTSDTMTTYLGNSIYGFPLCQAASGHTGFSISKMYAKTGAVRLLSSFQCNRVNGTTVGIVVNHEACWTDTTTNITSMTFDSYDVNAYGVGTRIIILKSNNFTNGTPTGIITTPYIKGSWVRIDSRVLSSPASSVAFSTLDGNRDVIYYLSAQVKAAGNTDVMRINFNVDYSAGSPSTLYGYQYMLGQNTTLDAARLTSYRALSGPLTSSSGNNGSMGRFIFAKSGFVRPSIGWVINNINGTTVTDVALDGGVWNNTTDNLVTIYTNNNISNNWATGSQFDLYALRPNG